MDQNVLPFPKLCRCCKKPAELDYYGTMFCEKCFQDYDSGSLRLKRVLYQLQRIAKIGKVQLKGVAVAKEGEVGLTLKLDAFVPHRFAPGGDAKSGIQLVREPKTPASATPPPTPEKKRLPAITTPTPPTYTPKKREPLILKWSDVNRTANETPTL